MRTNQFKKFIENKEQAEIDIETFIKARMEKLVADNPNAIEATDIRLVCECRMGDSLNKMDKGKSSASITLTLC